jgi:GNAT superfamily N-acetyltransferase
MCDEWMPTLALPLTAEQFHRLPRNPAFKYELFGGQAYLSPRPKHFHAVLELPPAPAEGPARLRPFQVADWEGLVPLFAGAFRHVQPFGSLDDETLAEAARKCLERTRTGGDGPFVEAASFVALDEHDGRPNGAALVTLLPEGDPCDWDSYAWRDPPPPDALERRLGRPHLTWIFVAPLARYDGLGSALLAAAADALLGLGYRRLFSTFLLGNDSSMLWHWRNGFRLLPYPGSRRLLRRRWEERRPRP